MGLFFIRVLNMSITVSWLIAAVILLRLLLKRAPRWISCILWAFVALRLICPFQIESAFSLVPDGEPVSVLRMPVRDAPQDGMALSVNPNANESGDTDTLGGTDIGLWDEALEKAESGAMVSGSAQNAGLAGTEDRMIYADVLGIVWLCGMAVLLLYSAISYGRLYRRTAVSVRLEGRIRQCDAIQTPFILGMVRPHIYLPSDLEEAQAEYVIAHEKMHLKRGDHVWKPLGFFILSVYWFHPLCWISYILFCRDMELACDERVIRERDEPYRKSYAEALFACSVRQKSVTACPLAFGEVGVKERVKNVMNYKKPAFWIVLAAIAVCLVVAVCFLTNPQKEESIRIAQDTDEQNVRVRAEDGAAVIRVSDSGGNGVGADGKNGGTDPVQHSELGTQGMQEGDAQGMPDAVWEAARHYVQTAFDQAAEDVENAVGPGNSYMDWRILDVTYCYTYEQIAGMVCDVYRLNYEFLAQSPEDIVLAGGMSMSEDGWVVPESPNSHYLLFAKEGDMLSYFCGMYENDCEPGDELFTSDLIDYCLEIGMFDESEGFNPNGEELLRRLADIDVEVLHTVPYTQNITGDYTGVKVEVTKEDGTTCQAEIVCLGELPDHGIRLYGYNDEWYIRQGVIVENGNSIAYFDWGYMTPRMQFPKIYWNEQTGQLQITLPIYTGTSFAAEKLVVLQYDEMGCAKPYYFELEEFTALINSILSYRFDEENGILTIIDKRTDETAATVTLQGENVYGIWSGDISEFILGETILFCVIPGYLTDAASPQYDGMPAVEVEVEIMDDGNPAFTLGALHQ